MATDDLKITRSWLKNDRQAELADKETRRDLTKRKEAEESIRQMKRRYRSLFDEAPVMYVITRNRGNVPIVEDCNQLFSSVLCYSRDEILGRPLANFYTPQSRAKLLAGENYQRTLERYSVAWECQLLTSDGRVFETLLRLTPETDPDGRISGMRAMYVDITKRKEAEAALRQSEAKFRTLAETVAAAIFIHRDGQLRYVNSTAEAITGYSRAELLGMKLSNLVHLDFQEYVAAQIMAYKLGKRVLPRHELKILTKCGRERWVDVTSGVIEFEGKPALLGTGIDITDRKQAEAALEAERALLAQRVKERTAELTKANAELARAARLKDEFLASMSHELRTPLTVVLNLAEILQQTELYGPLNGNQLKYMQNIEESGRHLLSLINDILDLSKIEAGKSDLEIGPISVETVCQASLKFIEPAASKKQLKVSSTFDSALTALEVDQRRLKQILVNLLNNAVKFTPEGGAIGLEVEGDSEQQLVHFSVWDTGIGIHPKDIERLFKPFVQVDSSLGRRHSGTGLGLALVSRLTEMHRGSVAVKSEVGKGSRFTVSLPWLAPAARKTKRREVEEPGSEGDEERQPASGLPSLRPGAPLILVVDDNQNTVIALSDYLSSKGYRVIVARSGSEGIELARERRPDVILMDIQLPGMDGLEATRRLRAELRLATTPIIALTALAMPGDRERCLAAGASEYVAKPVSLKELVKLIEAQLCRPPVRV